MIYKCLIMSFMHNIIKNTIEKSRQKQMDGHLEKKSKCVFWIVYGQRQNISSYIFTANKNSYSRDWICDLLEHKFKELPFFILHDLGIWNMTNERKFTLIPRIFLKWKNSISCSAILFLYESFTSLDGMYFDSD